MSDIDHAAREHAEFAPSSASRWLACPMSVTPACATLPKKCHPFFLVKEEDTDTFHTARGTAMHERADHHLGLGTNPSGDRTPVVFTNPETSKEVSIDWTEWHDHVVPFVEGVYRVFDEECLLYGPELIAMLHEVKVGVWGDLCWGSVDGAVLSPEQLFVSDLKCGVKVVGADCDQLKTYACGLLNSNPQPNVDRKVALNISQAAAHDGGDTYETTESDLRTHHMPRIRNAIAESVHAAQNQILPTEKNIGEHCHYCPRLHLCPAHQSRALAALDAADGAKVEDLPDDKLAWAAGVGDQITAYIDAVKKEIFRRLMIGMPVEGWKVVEGRSVRQWTGDLTEDQIAAEIASMADMSGVELDPWDRKLTSFTKVEKALGKTTVDHLVVKPEGKPTLAPASDKRQAIAIKDPLSCLE